MTFSIIQKSQLEGAKRLDAEYYQPEYLNLFNNIMNFKAAYIREICDVLRGNTPKGYDSEGIKIVRSGDLSSDYFINEDLLQTRDEKIFWLEHNDILISSIGFGSIGKVNIYVGNRRKGGTVAEVTVLRNAKINSFFIWAFLRSKYGQFQINREITGATGQLHLNIKNVENILIPMIKNQELFEKLFNNAREQHLKSASYYSDAEKIFFENLGGDNFQEKNTFFTDSSLLEVMTAGRFDAEYFNSPCNKMLAKITKIKTAKLGDLVDITKGIEPGADAYQDEGKLFIRVSSISKDGIIDKDQKYLSDDLYNEYKKDYQPQVGDILLTKDASIGVACVVREPVEGIVAGGVLRLKLKEKMNPEYLALVLNSNVGRLQAERDAGGSIIAHWKPEQIKNLIVPILPVSTQQKIADLVVKSHEARKKARELLEWAKLKVEEIIERGGDKL